MAFADEVKINAKAGNGGDGLVSFRRERYIDKGGPDGGDGGQGGSIILLADHNETSLIGFLRNKNLRADDGVGGKAQKKAGKSAADLVVKVPVGTQVVVVSSPKRGKPTEHILADLDRSGERFVLARGGSGGLGNSHFARASFQTPKFAELGEPGDEREVILRLKMIAEVGIIGLPNAGKSTLLSVISQARPKIADYAFTTLVPNLGIIDFKGKRFMAADIPGIIEGAHLGKGLGLDFLKHIERTKVLIHVLDGTSGDIKADFKAINTELKKYSKTLAAKPQVIAINKTDVLTSTSLAELRKLKFGRYPVHRISAVTHLGLEPLLYDVLDTLNAIPAKPVAIPTYTIADLPNERYEVVKRARGWQVKGKKIERMLIKTNLQNEQALGRLYKILKRMGVQAELKKIGAKEGDRVKIGKFTIEYRIV
ncbi:GTPase ObgE [Patescibacteria group bacterium]|nr:GTPase ObgE [Patescibacteria group bacterium]